MNEDYLVHYGVLGMKWGVRRGHRYTSLSTHAHRGLKNFHSNRSKNLSEKAKTQTNDSARKRMVESAKKHSEKSKIQKTREERSAAHDKRIEAIAKKQSLPGTLAVSAYTAYTGKGAIAGLSSAKAYASLQASGMTKFQSLVRAGFLGQYASSFQKSRYIRTGKNYVERALEKQAKRASRPAMQHGDLELDSFLAHAGRKGMKRGMNIFNPDYKPIGKKAKGPQPYKPADKNKPKPTKEQLKRHVQVKRNQGVKRPFDLKKVQNRAQLKYGVKKQTSVNEKKNPTIYMANRSASTNSLLGGQKPKTMASIANQRPQTAASTSDQRPQTDNYVDRQEPQNNYIEPTSIGETEVQDEDITKFPQQFKYASDDNLKHLAANDKIDSLFNRVVKYVNPTYGSREGDNVNCQACTVAYELRRRGYNVSANLNDGSIENFSDALTMAAVVGDNPRRYTQKDAIDSLMKELSPYEVDKLKTDKKFRIEKMSEKLEQHGVKNAENWYKCGAQNYVEPSNEQSYYKDLWDDILKNNPDGARGAIATTWESGGGHSIAWEIIDGELKIIDNQLSDPKGKACIMQSPEEFEKMYDPEGSQNAKTLGWTRLDDKTLEEKPLTTFINNNGFGPKTYRKGEIDPDEIPKNVTKFLVGDNLYNVGRDILDMLLKGR